MNKINMEESKDENYNIILHDNVGANPDIDTYLRALNQCDSSF